MKLLLLLLVSSTLFVQAEVDCSKRSQGACEDDDLCIKLKGSVCQNANRGSAIAGEACQSSLAIDDDGNMIYTDVDGMGCAAGFICTIDNATSTTTAPIEGTCVPTSCNGKKVPGNCNGNIDNKEQCAANTQRVTICHRTCSESNPWVRITIDEDAWSGEGCGHQLQHDVTVECKNKAPWTAWGVNRKDYLIKFHGTRDHVKAINKFNTQEEKAYWKKWEPACPYVRNGACCSWTDPENPCCGDPPTALSNLPQQNVSLLTLAPAPTDAPVAPTPAPVAPTEAPVIPVSPTAGPTTPSVSLQKLAGPVGTCGQNMDLMVDGVYTATDLKWEYCYVLTVNNDGNECLLQALMTDASEYGLGTYPVTGSGPNGEFCPGDSVTVPGPESSSATGDLPVDAIFSGVGKVTGNNVSASDSAGVNVPPYEPAVAIKKLVGKPGLCGVDMDLAQLYDVSYTADDLTFQYCYVVINEGNECLKAVVMNDAAPKGVAGDVIIVGDKQADMLCPGETQVIAGPSSTTTTGEPSVPAIVTAIGEFTDIQVQDQDPAFVTVPDFEPSISIKKYAGPPDLDVDDLDISLLQDESYLTSDSTFSYYFVVENTGNECLKAAFMSDAADKSLLGEVPIVGDTQSDLFCPGEKKTLAGPSSTTETGEPSIEAIAKGTGQYSNIEVQAKDGAAVNVPVSPAGEEPADQTTSFTPSITITKFAGAVGSCPVDMETPVLSDFSALADDTYLAEDTTFEFCYWIVNTGDECLLNAQMIDAAPKGLASLDLVGSGPAGEFCPGDFIVVASPPASTVSGEASDAAVVTGTGQESGIEVTAQDDASVVVPEDVPASEPAAPEGRTNNNEEETPDSSLPEEPAVPEEPATDNDEDEPDSPLPEEPAVPEGPATDNDEDEPDSPLPEEPAVPEEPATDNDEDEPDSPLPEEPAVPEEPATDNDEDEPDSALPEEPAVPEEPATDNDEDEPDSPLPEEPAVPEEPATDNDEDEPDSALPEEPAVPEEPATDNDEDEPDSPLPEEPAVPEEPATDNDEDEPDSALPEEPAVPEEPATDNDEDEPDSLLPEEPAVPEEPATDNDEDEPDSPLPEEPATDNDEDEPDSSLPEEPTGDEEPAGANEPGNEPVEAITSFSPSITITKFAGAVGSCPVDMDTPALSDFSALSDDTYLAEDTTFEFCYWIVNTGNECLLNAQMADAAPKGLASHDLVGSGPAGEFCPGDFIVVASPPASTVSGEASDAAVVSGTGQESGIEVEAKDAASVVVPEDLPASEPTVSEEPNNNNDNGEDEPSTSLPNGSEYCPMSEVPGVRVMVKGAEESANDLDILFDIAQLDGDAIEYKLRNPFSAASNMQVYTQFQGLNSEFICEEVAAADSNSGGGNAEAIVAKCMHNGGHPIAIIQVYFVDSEDSLVNQIFGPVTIDKCCHADQDTPSTSVAQYTFLVRCACPEDEDTSMEAHRRDQQKLRGTAGVSKAAASKWGELISMFGESRRH